MQASKTHNQILLRPPPGTRFTLIVGADGMGSDVALEFQRGREREIVEWLKQWILMYVEPEAVKADAIKAHAEVERKKKILAKRTPQKPQSVDHAALAVEKVAGAPPPTTNEVPLEPEPTEENYESLTDDEEQEEEVATQVDLHDSNP